MLEASDINLYYGASHILRGAHVSATRGKITCLLGRNGVGKTSLLRGLTGHTPIRSGSVTWDGENISRLPPFARARRGIAYVPQGRDVFPRLSVEENLMTGFACLPRSEARIPDQVFELFPVLSDMLQRRGGDLSGGQQQRVAVARAVVARPKIILADEPTGNLDSKNGDEVMSLLSGLNESGTTIAMVTHSPAYAEYAHRVIHLFDGHVVTENIQEDYRV